MFAAFRELTGCAVLGIDHVTKVNADSEGPTTGPLRLGIQDQNLARSVFEKKAEREHSHERTEVTLIDRKPNYRGRLETIELVIVREDGGRCIRFHRTEVAAAELQASLSLRERMRRACRHGARHEEEPAKDLDTEVKRIREVMRRHRDDFTRWPDGRIGRLTNSVALIEP